MSIKAELMAGHPGEVLDELYLKPLNMSAGKLAKALGVPRSRIERIVKGQTAITAETALRLGKFFSSTPDLWLNMQSSWDLAQERDRTAPALAKIQPIDTAA